VVTFDETTSHICRKDGNNVTGLWILAEYPPINNCDYGKLKLAPFKFIAYFKFEFQSSYKLNKQSLDFLNSRKGENYAC
jgi:hypothetical protein